MMPGIFDTSEIGEAERLRRELHKARNELTVAKGGQQLIAIALGLPADAPLSTIIVRAQELA